MAYVFPQDFSEDILLLLLLGEDDARKTEWIDYTEFLSTEHIPELIRIIRKIEIFMPEDEEAYKDDAPETYAPIHAWRALGQLKAEEAIPALINLIISNDNLDIDWIMEEMPRVMALIGPVCIPPLREYLLNPKKLEWAATTCSSCLEKMGLVHSESRTDCVKALEEALENYAANEPGVNGSIIASLTDLNASESAPIVKRAFDADVVDLMIMGDYEDYQVEVGLIEKRITLAKNHFEEKFHMREMMQDVIENIRMKEQIADFYALVDPDIKKGKF